MADLGSLYEAHKDLTEEQQRQVGKAVAGDMTASHTDFVKEIARMVTAGEINVFKTDTFFKSGAYEALSETDRAQVDLAMINLADLLRHVAEFYISKKTPDASPQLQQMIDQLWLMKERLVQKFGSILKF